MLHTKAIIFLLGRNLFMLDKGKHFLLLTVSTLIMAIGTYFFKFTNNFTFGGIGTATFGAIILNAVMSRSRR